MRVNSNLLPEVLRRLPLPYYIPQHTGSLGKSVSEVLGVNEKLSALDAITKGSISESDYDLLADDWLGGCKN